MKIPYHLIAAVKTEQRHHYMAEALAHGFPRLQPRPIDDDKSISLVCYGPSLLDTWAEITPPIITVSGALHFLAERGIIADYHVDCDPRLHKTQHLQPPVDGVHYLIGSCCHPSTWEILKSQKISLVHFYMSPQTLRS